MKINKILAAIVSASMLLSGVPAAQAAASNTTNNSWQLYEAQQDRQDDVFQYHFAGGTDDYMNGRSVSGKTYDSYLWVPNSVAPGELKGLVAIKANLVEVPFVYSAKLKNALAEKGFGILFLVFQKDSYGYNNTFNSFNTRKDYKGDPVTLNDDALTTDGKDAADIMNDILSGIAASSGYSEIADTTPLITIGHSAASPFGYRSGNWNPDRIIAQVQMKNGMGAPLYMSNNGMVPGIPSLQYAAQYTEHAVGSDRDRSVRDARWHIANQRSNENMLVSHIIEWGSGHYDWSDNATDMLTKYIQKAIEYRLPDNYNETHKLNDLTQTGYLMKPFEKDGSSEREEGYYQSQGGWLSSGKENSGASEADKKTSFWFFDKEFAEEVNRFTAYAIPESPDSKGTNIIGKTFSNIEPFMLMKDPTQSTYVATPVVGENVISPYMTFANNPFSRYGSLRFVNYEKLANSTADASNAANLGGYDTLTVDTYYMNKVPSITYADDRTAYDYPGSNVTYPANTKAEVVPLMAPYEIVKSEAVDMSGMTKAEGNTEADNVAAVTRTTLRFHNNRVYYSAGCSAINEYKSQLDSFAMILSPEITENGTVTSAFKSTGVQMNVPYVSGKTEQTLTLNHIPNVNIKAENASTIFNVNYTSSDNDLQNYTDVFVEYGPAKAVRTVDSSDGSYSWKIELLPEEIPENAVYPIEVNVVASNLGKWEKVNGATVSQKFYITDRDTKTGIYLDDVQQNSFNEAVDGAKAADTAAHTVLVASGSYTTNRLNTMEKSENITFVNGDFAVEVKQTSSDMMFLSDRNASNPTLTFGKPELNATNRAAALTFNVNGKNRFAEINKGSLNLYNGVVITGGNAARGGGIDCKTGSTLNVYGGIITGNTATVTQTSDLGGGGVSIVGGGIANMDGGIITGNTSTTDKGGGVSVTENGSFNMSGGTITGNSGYDVYVNNNNMKMSGSAKIGSLYLAADKTLTVSGAFTTSGPHAEITPGAYKEGAVLVNYADGVTPSISDFTVAADGDAAWYVKIDGQKLVLTQTTPHEITGKNVTVQNKASVGETVTVTLPDNYVKDSLVVSGLNPNEFTKVSDNQYSFIMPDKAVNVSCLVNNDPSKVIVVGTHDTYYVRNDNSMKVTFNVPNVENGYVYSKNEVNIPVRAGADNVLNMTAAMNGVSYTVSSGNISGSGSVNVGSNTLTVTNENSNGVDYYAYKEADWNKDNPRYPYPQTAENLSTLTLTKAVSAEAEKITAEDVDKAAQNPDAVGYYVENFTIPSWNPTLKWHLTFADGRQAAADVNIPALSGEGSISFGIILSGVRGDYATSDITKVMVIE